ncbi:MAG: hypothetical protein J6S67_00140 [Methanobrevibacter sp.]|nr:hypothetical protein [Methanobrevibacter sp.]
MFNPMQLMGMYQQFMQNPMAMLSKSFNIPQNINNPQDIIQHLLSTNQISQTDVNNAMSMKNNFMNK